MIVDKKDIIAYIPHREPFLMVDGLVKHSDLESTSSLFIDKENSLVLDNVLTEEGLLEHQAQALALSMGYSQSQKHKASQLGVIGALKQCVIYSLPPVGQTITTNVHIKSQFLNMVLAQANTYNSKKELIAQSILKTASVS